MQYVEAQLTDIPQLCGLLEQLFAQEVEFTPDVKTQTKALQEILSDSKLGKIFVAKENIKVVAMVNILFSISTALGTRVGILEDMVVDADYRGAGIGTKLIEFALKSAKEEGCKRVTLLTDVDNLQAHKFYMDEGFSKSSMIPFRKLL